jgi:hypothetical protein
MSLLLEWLPSRRQTTTNIGKDVGRKESLCTAGGNVNEYNPFGKQYRDSSTN